MKDNDLPLPVRRCLSRDEAASYLGIGVTLLIELAIPSLKIGRRIVYDIIDLNGWLEEYKQRGRARKEFIWPKKPESISELTPPIGGSMQHSQTAKEYAKVLGLQTVQKPKRS